MIKALAISLLVFVSISSAIIITQPSTVIAATGANCSETNAGFLDFPTWYKFLEPDFVGGECKLLFLERGDNGLINALPRILLAVFEIILRIGGVAAVGFVIYGGIQYILSQGEPERTKASKNTIINALVGLMIAMLATVIVNLIGNSVS